MLKVHGDVFCAFEYDFGMGGRKEDGNGIEEVGGEGEGVGKGEGDDEEMREGVKEGEGK